MSERQQIQTGEEAQRVLDSGAYQDAMKALRNQIVEQWKACPVRDAEGQLLLLQLAKMADKFEGILYGYVSAGHFAERKIDLDVLRNEGNFTKLRRRMVG